MTTSENSTDASACACPEKKYDDTKGSCFDVFEGVDEFTLGTTLETLKLEPGYWRTGNTSIDVRECPVAEACVGGTGGTGRNGTNYCRDGHEGPYL